MSDLIDRLRDYANQRKGELADLVNEAADALEKIQLSGESTTFDLISRQAAIDAIDEYIEKNRRPDFIGNMVWVSGVADAMRIVSELPSVQERKGHDTGESRWFHCSECGYGVFDVYLDDEQKYDLAYHYCPNCGAKMDEVTECKTK